MATRLLLQPRTGSAAVKLSTHHSTVVGSGRLVTLTTHPNRRRFVSSALAANPHICTGAAFPVMQQPRSIFTMASPNGTSQNVSAKKVCEGSGAAKLITPQNLNPNIVKMEYAVRGPLVIRAAEIERELKAVSVSSGTPHM